MIAWSPSVAAYTGLVLVYSFLPSLLTGGSPKLASRLLLSEAAVLSLSLIWGVYFLIRYSLAVAVVTMEKASVRDSLRRSGYLTRGRRARIFLVFLLTTMIAAALSMALEFPARLFPRISEASWVAVADFVATTLAGPFATIAMALVYYDERVRKEAFDLDLMIEGLAPAVSPAGTAGGKRRGPV
jgi:hypothetical protein